ncbi:MAG: MFS transporter [Sphingobacteriales bacterium]|nr:MAG: MFS transporter [Sphingobacteriales bacterium]
MNTQEPKNWKRAFGFIWAGQFLSLVSTALVNFALIIWLSLESGSAEVLAVAATCAMLPQTLIGLFAGVYVDKWNRKLTMMLADGGIALCTLIIALLFMAGWKAYTVIYILLALRSVGSAFHMPAMQSSVPLLAPQDQLLRISGINQMIFSISNIAGPALGALLITILPIEQVLLLDVAGAACAIISLLFVTIPDPERDVTTEDHSVFDDFKVGIRTITRFKGMPQLFLGSIFVTILIMPLAILFPLMTVKHFLGAEFQMSIIEITWGVGMLIGGALIGLIKIPYNKAVMINFTYIALGAAMAGSGLLPPAAFIIFVVFTFVGGLVSAVYNACFTTILQERINPAVLGRVFSIFMSASILPSLIGLLGIGYLADIIGITSTFVIFGTAISLVGTLSLFSPGIIAIGKKHSPAQGKKVDTDKLP